MIAQEKTNETNDDITVYITKTGSKYHSENCSYLNGNGISKKLSEVKEKYSPCSKCNPLKSTIVLEEKNKTTGEKKVATEKKTTSGKTIYTGPRGGKYYINKNGNKTYIKKNK